MDRSALHDALVEAITAVVRPHPVRVGIDGVDGAGKTTLANELVAPLQRRGVPVIRASIDGFHHPRAVRYRLGRRSPDGYFRDSFNHEAVAGVLLAPLGPGGSRRYRPAVFDHRTDSELSLPVETAPPNAVLLFDGIFLHRLELRAYWDLSLFLDAPFTTTIGRCARRDGGSPDVGAVENRRYVEGQQIYLRECDPRRRATLVIDNDDLTSPDIVRHFSGSE